MKPLPFTIKEIIRMERKTLSICVFPDTSIVVKIPLTVEEKEVEAFISRKSNWIQKQLNYFAQFSKKEALENKNGSSVLYLGRQYQLIIERGGYQQSIKIEKNKIIISILKDKKVDIQKILYTWFTERADIIFREVLDTVMRDFVDAPYPILKIRKLSRRWGSYNTRHEVTLNKILIHAPKLAIRYVLTHELCHFYYRHHNKAFYELLSSKIPDWRNIEKNLEKKLLMP